MKAARLSLLALACSLPLVAAAQWQWVDKDGRKVFSDRAPPADIAPEKVLRRPAGARLPVTEAPAATPTAAAPAAPAAAASVPKPLGKDKALEDRKKQADAAEAEKKKAEEAKLAAARADNCGRAKSAKATYESGVRISRVNDKGEREILDDNQRASEVKHLDAIIARDCAK